MALINELEPMLRSGRLTLSLERVGSNIRAVVIPVVGGIDPETDDLTKASLQAALATPLVCVLDPASDMDTQLSQALAQARQARGATLGQLEAYLQSQEQARAAARAAKETTASSKPVKASPASGGTAATASTGQANTVPPAEVHVSQSAAAEASVPTTLNLNLFGETL